jgi:hypothetical protein
MASADVATAKASATLINNLIIVSSHVLPQDVSLREVTAKDTPTEADHEEAPARGEPPSPCPRHAALALAEHCQHNAEIGRNRLVEPRRAANARRSSWS